MKPDKEKIEILINRWDEVLDNAKSVSWCNTDLDKELFRQTLYDTWEVFRDVIDFSAPDDEYSLPIDFARVFCKVTQYSIMNQIIIRSSWDCIFLPTLICEYLRDAIVNRADFSREKPVIEGQVISSTRTLDFEYDLLTGEMAFFLPADEGNEPREPRKPMIKKNIARWEE